MDLCSVWYETTGRCTEAAELVRLHWRRHDALWAGWRHQEAVGWLRRAGQLWESCWVPAERLCWLVSPHLPLGLMEGVTFRTKEAASLSFIHQRGFISETWLLFVLPSSATSTKWRESASQNTSPLSRTCCDLESKQPVSSKNSSPAKSCTSGESQRGSCTKPYNTVMEFNIQHQHFWRSED